MLAPAWLAACVTVPASPASGSRRRASAFLTWKPGSRRGSRPAASARRGACTEARAWPSILALRAAVDEGSPDGPVGEARRGRRRAAERIGKVRHGRHAPIGEDIERRELREPEPEAAELRREPDDELAPQSTTHRDAFRELPGIRGPQ